MTNVPTIRTKKVSSRKRDELKEELSVKTATEQSYLLRLNGGFNNKKQNVMSIAEELYLRQKEVSLLQIQHDGFKPINPTFEFQMNQLWLDAQRVSLNDQITGQLQYIERIKEQEKKINDELPSIQARIKEINEYLGLSGVTQTGG